jgi:hypothetical protein
MFTHLFRIVAGVHRLTGSFPDERFFLPLHAHTERSSAPILRYRRAR